MLHIYTHLHDYNPHITVALIQHMNPIPILQCKHYDLIIRCKDGCKKLIYGNL